VVAVSTPLVALAAFVTIIVSGRQTRDQIRQAEKQLAQAAKSAKADRQLERDLAADRANSSG
jgi:hypothetical protein